MAHATVCFYGEHDVRPREVEPESVAIGGDHAELPYRRRHAVATHDPPHPQPSSLRIPQKRGGAVRHQRVITGGEQPCSQADVVGVAERCNSAEFMTANESKGLGQQRPPRRSLVAEPR
jgi:hypothetical protein